MPRRGRSGGFGPRPSPPMQRPVQSRPASTLPAHPPQAAPTPAMAQPKRPGLFAQMATTAAGVAVGSAVGHTIGAAMSGGGGHSEPAPQQEAAPVYSQQPMQQQQGPVCQYELKQFLECAQSQTDIGLCQGFNEALRQCKMQYGVQL